MGEYFLVVNSAKRQYIDAIRFGENNKRSGIMVGNHARAFGLLLCDTARRDRDHPLVGSWVGDAVFITGDDYAPPNSAGIKTSTDENPTRNLYFMAREEFEDISHQAIVMLITEDYDKAEEFARRCNHDGSLIIELGHIVFNIGCPKLLGALEKVLGNDWTKRYREACKGRNGISIQITSGNYQHRISVADLIEAPSSLATHLKNARLDAHVEIYRPSGNSVKESQCIWLGMRVPPAIAVQAIRIAVKHWPFLRYVKLSTGTDDVPDFIHNLIFFGGSTSVATSRNMSPWTESDFQGLEPSMTQSELHAYVKERYGPDFKRPKKRKK